MKRVPYSYSTFPDTQVKADTKAKREGTTVSTKIHNFLLDYTKDELDPAHQPPGPASTNTTDAAPGNQPKNAPAIESEAIRSENTSEGSELLQLLPAPGTESIEEDPEPITQPENNTAGQPVEAVHSDNNPVWQEPYSKENAAPPVKKKSSAGKAAKKAASATVKKTPPKKELKKVTPKPVVAAKKKNQIGKTKKSKA
jgi:hypothetical protein